MEETHSIDIQVEPEAEKKKVYGASHCHPEKYRRISYK